MRQNRKATACLEAKSLLGRLNKQSASGSFTSVCTSADVTARWPIIRGTGGPGMHARTGCRPATSTGSGRHPLLGRVVGRQFGTVESFHYGTQQWLSIHFSRAACSDLDSLSPCPSKWVNLSASGTTRRVRDCRMEVHARTRPEAATYKVDETDSSRGLVAYRDHHTLHSGARCTGTYDRFFKVASPTPIPPPPNVDRRDCPGCPPASRVPRAQRHRWSGYYHCEFALAAAVTSS